VATFDEIGVFLLWITSNRKRRSNFDFERKKKIIILWIKIVLHNMMEYTVYSEV
jgi:hypothetical protein